MRKEVFVKFVPLSVTVALASLSSVMLTIADSFVIVWFTTFENAGETLSVRFSEAFTEMCTKVRSLAPMAAKYGMTIPQLVLAATLRHPAVTCAIVGAKRPEQMREAAGAMGRAPDLTVEDYNDIRDALA